MKATICDKCGKIAKNPETGQFSITGVEPLVYDLDLCEKCVEEVRAWLKDNFKYGN